MRDMESATHVTADGSLAEARAADLRAVGLRATQQRLAVLAALDSPATAEHLLAEEVCRAVQSSGGPASAISLQSVYVILGDLERAGLIRKVDLGTGRALYEATVDDNHHHAICRVCGRVDDVPCSVGHAPCIDPGLTSLRVEAAEVIFRGVCSECDSGGQAPSSFTSTPVFPIEKTE